MTVHNAVNPLFDEIAGTSRRSVPLRASAEDVLRDQAMKRRMSFEEERDRSREWNRKFNRRASSVLLLLFLALIVLRLWRDLSG
jgi:hypothetical protein